MIFSHGWKFLNHKSFGKPSTPRDFSSLACRHLFGLYPWARFSVGAPYFSVLWSCCLLLSRVQLFAIPCTIACQAPLSMGFPRQEYWSELPFPSPGGIFLTQESNLCLLLGRQILYYWATEKNPCLQVHSLITWLPSSVRIQSFSLIQNFENSLKF